MERIQNAVTEVFSMQHPKIMGEYNATYQELNDDGVYVTVTNSDGRRIEFEIFLPTEDASTYIGVMKTVGLRYSQITALMDGMLGFL